MKKILIFILSITCIFCLFMASACEKQQEPENPVDNSVVMLKGFNVWDDLILFDLNPTDFKGNWEINRDTDYIVEGDGSWRIYVEKTGANQPNFRIKDSQMKADITDVTFFGMWVYSDAEYEFEIIITAFNGDDVVCAPTQKVVKGANELKFPLNRAIILETGKSVTEYSISFSGIQGGATVYIDNFYAKTTTDAVVIKPEIQEVINAIKAFSSSPSREVVEAAMAKYNALSMEDKLCVNNASRLKSAIEPYYLTDLAEAQTNNPETLLYFGKQFGEVQIDSVTAGIGAYAYSTEQKHGEEEGALKVEFSTSSTYWVTLKTNVTTTVAEEYIEFYVYNDSDQPKAMCVGWHAPMNDLLKQPLYVIKSREWTKIYCKSADLYDAGGASGGIQMCGLVTIDPEDERLGGSEAPSGAMYFSSFIKRDDKVEVQKARTGEDANTLLFYDRELGLKQVTATNAEIALSDKVKYQNENTTAITFADVKSAQFNFNNFGYEFKEGDYVALYAKIDMEDADYLRLRLGYHNGTLLHNGKWALLLFSASDVATTEWFWGEAYKDGGNYKADVSATGKGTIYLTKAKVYSAEQVKNLTTVEDTFEYNIGSTKFVGKVNEFMKGSYNNNPNVFNSDWYNFTYLVDDVLRVYAKSDNADNKTNAQRNTVIGLELKNRVSSNNKKIYITASGLGEEPVLQVFVSREQGHFESPRGKVVATTEDGYTTYCFELTKNTSLKYFRLWTGHGLIIPDIELVTIRDITIK